MSNLFTALAQKLTLLLRKDKKMLAHGNVFLGNGELERAQQCYEDAIAINPNYAEAYLNLAFVLKEQGEYDLAETSLLSALSSNPALADGFYMLALIYQHKSSFELAIDNFKKSILLNPDFDFAYRDFYALLTDLKQEYRLKDFLNDIITQHPACTIANNYLGLLYRNEKDNNAAINCYLTSLSINSENSHINYLLADLYFKTNQIAEAEKYCKQCLAIDPLFLESNLILGEILVHQKLFDQAVNHYQSILAQNNASPRVWYALGNIYAQQRKLDIAVDCFKRVKELDPEHAFITHLISAFTGQTPDLGSPQYSESLFDKYAPNFNKSLTADLQYSAPQILSGLLFKNTFFTSHPMSILDIGCGTGLVGKLLKPQSNYLVGIDISRNMLEEARKLNIYDRLEHCELLSFMKNEPACRYDVITSADVFIYVGKLDDVFSEAKRLLVSGGLLAFSVEALDEKSLEETESTLPFQLQLSARYAHHSSYIKNLSQSNQFNIIKMELDQLRHEDGKPLYAWYVLCEAL